MNRRQLFAMLFGALLAAVMPPKAKATELTFLIKADTKLLLEAIEACKKILRGEVRVDVTIEGPVYCLDDLEQKIEAAFRRTYRST